MSGQWSGFPFELGSTPYYITEALESTSNTTSRSVTIAPTKGHCDGHLAFGGVTQEEKERQKEETLSKKTHTYRQRMHCKCGLYCWCSKGSREERPIVDLTAVPMWVQKPSLAPLVVFFDGASRGNPGWGAAGAVLFRMRRCKLVNSQKFQNVLGFSTNSKFSKVLKLFSTSQLFPIIDISNVPIHIYILFSSILHIFIFLFYNILPSQNAPECIKF